MGSMRDHALLLTGAKARDLKPGGAAESEPGRPRGVSGVQGGMGMSEPWLHREGRSEWMSGLTGRRGLGRRVKSVPKDRPPLCVARLLEGAEAGRIGWIMALPPSLDLEIQAIRQVGSASMETLHVSLCRPSLWPEQHLIITCPFPAFSALAPALKTPRPCSLTSSLTSLWSHHQFPPYLFHTFPPIVLSQPHSRALFHLCPAWAPTFLWPSKVHIQLLLPGAGCSQCWPLQSSVWSVAVGRGGGGGRA